MDCRGKRLVALAIQKSPKKARLSTEESKGIPKENIDVCDSFDIMTLPIDVVDDCSPIIENTYTSIICNQNKYFRKEEIQVPIDNGSLDNRALNIFTLENSSTTDLNSNVSINCLETEEKTNQNKNFELQENEKEQFIIEKAPSASDVQVYELQVLDDNILNYTDLNTDLNVFEKDTTDKNNTSMGSIEQFEHEDPQEQENENDSDFQPPVDNEVSSSEDDANDDEVFVAKNDDGGTTEPTAKVKMAKRTNQKELNQKLREKGKSYLGYRRPAGQKRTFHDTQRKERKLGPACTSKFCKKSGKRKCSDIPDDKRSNIYQQFWNNLSWDERKIYVTSLITVVPPKEKKSIHESSRRGLTFQYHLKVDNERLPVCKQMFISTLCIKERSIQQWVLNSNNGITQKKKHDRNLARNKKPTQKSFLENFLNSLNKMPSHYCRRETNKLYLEQHFTTLTELYDVYKSACQISNEEPLSRSSVLNQMNISLYQPKKDKCDICIQHELKNISEEEWLYHKNIKERAREEKNKDKEASEKETCHTLTMDLQAVKVCPSVNASSVYYKTKLCVHNFTIFNLATRHCSCYWFNETEADLQASTFATCLVDYIKTNFNDSKPIIIYSDGCLYQNKNAVMSNALLHLSKELQVTIEQKYLAKGHTQMECDSVHAVIERKIKNKMIHLPSDYSTLCKMSRKTMEYDVLTLEYKFVKNYKLHMAYHSIRPGRMVGDPTVNDIRALQYLPEGIIKYKTNFDDEYVKLPIRPKPVKSNVVFPQLYTERLPIKKSKFDHLQQLKPVIPKDCWDFYDNLPYKNNDS